MRKVATFLWILVLFLIVMSTSLAESVNDESIQTILKNCKSFEYDKFSKSWKISGSWEKKYSDASVYLQVSYYQSFLEKKYNPNLAIVFTYQGQYCPSYSFQAAIGDKVYSFENLSQSDTGYSYLFIGKTGYDFLKALYNAYTTSGAIDLQLSFSHEGRIKQITVSSDQIDNKSFASFCDVFYYMDKAGLFNIYDNPEGLDSAYGASVF